MLNKIKEIVNSNPNKKLLIQTDEIDFFQFIKNIYPNCFFIEENKMIKKSKTAIQFTLKNGEKIINAQTFLATTLILSECSELIINSGNVGMWICLFRGNNKNVHQYLNPFNSNMINKWF